MCERIIVTLTTWEKRIKNIPAVLDTIFAQSLPPDFVVLNLAYNEEIPSIVQDYIANHRIEINRVPDTKVYKKLLPTLKKYPNDCIIAIDDDWLYPDGMIEDFVNTHHKYPNNPISGNNEILYHLQCHCGCASLVKTSYFGEYLNLIDDDVIEHCSSDDIVYTYFASKAGNPYIRTNKLYFNNMQPFNNSDSYSETIVKGNGIYSSFMYLTDRFGKLSLCISSYIKDQSIAKLIQDIIEDEYIQGYKKGVKETEHIYLSSYTYRLGLFLLNPLIWIKDHTKNLIKFG